MKRACLLAALLAILLPVGCAKKGAGLSGTYKRQVSKPAGEWTITFHHDGTCEGTAPGEVLKGTYELEGRNLTITATESNGKPTQGREAEPITATLSEDGKSFNTEDNEYIKQE